MKIDVEIVTGFLGSGKTSLINSILSQSQVIGEKIIVFQLEQGKAELSKVRDINYPLKVIKLKNVEDLNEKMMHAIRKFDPNRIIIEYNGTEDINKIFTLLNQKSYKKCSRISTVFFVADGKTLDSYVNNMKNFLVPFIRSSQLIIINDIDSADKKLLECGVDKVKKINPKAYILKVNNKYSLNYVLKESKLLDNGYIKKLKVKIKNHKLKHF